MVTEIALLDMAFGKAPMALWILKKEYRVVIDQYEAARRLHGSPSVFAHADSKRGVVKTLLINWDQKHL